MEKVDRSEQRLCAGPKDWTISIPHRSMGGLLCMRTYFGFYCCIWMISQRETGSFERGIFPSEKKTDSVPHRFWCSEGHGGIDLTRPDWIVGTVPAVHPSSAAFIHIFPFLLHLHPFWVKLAQCDDQWDPADSCQPPRIEANCWDGKQQASFPADKNTNMNCYYYYPISRLSVSPEYSATLPLWVVNKGAKILQIRLFIYITSRENINAQFPSSGPSYNAFILCK